MTISYQTPVPISLSSQNGSLVLSRKNPQNFYSFRLLFFNSTVNVTVKYYDINGKLVNTVTYTTPESISVKNGDYSLITWNDANNYQVQGWYQEIIPSSQEDITKLTTEFDLNAVPIGQVNINSPLDANGNVKVNATFPYPLTVKSLTGSTNATINTKTQITSTSTLVKHFQFVNTSSTSGVSILIGDVNNQAIEVLANGSFFFDGNNETTDLSQWYVISGTASVPYVVVYEQ
jgi:hypothetical protein